jgi:outer membrane protein assembly factor BamA
VAFRTAHYGRYGKSATNNLFYPLYLGYPGFMRGLDYSSLYRIRNQMSDDEGDFSFDMLQGTRLLLGGLELKVPFTGPKRLALIPSGFLFTELNWFLDAGMAWNDGSAITLDKDKMNSNYRFPIFTTGPSVRINLFGALIIEPYYAIPFTLRDRWPGVWGLSFWPGW